MSTEKNKARITLVSAYCSMLTSEFNDHEYGDNRFFFPDNVAIRNAKFMLWIMKKYGVEEQFINDLEQFELLETLKRENIS